MADRAEWQSAVEAEVRALGRELSLDPGDLSAMLEPDPGKRVPERVEVALAPALADASDARAFERLVQDAAGRVARVEVAALLAVLLATPQGRAVIIHVFRFAGIELRQEPGPARSAGSGASLPGERRMSLEQARHQVSFPILVPAALGQPSEVVVSDGGRVASLTYRRTPYGEVRMDEFAGHLDPLVFQKFVHFGHVTEVEVNGFKGMWIKGPHELVYINGGQRGLQVRLDPNAALKVLEATAVPVVA